MKLKILLSLLMISNAALAEEPATEARTPATETVAGSKPAAAATSDEKSGQSLDDVIQKVLKTVIDKTAAAKGRVAVMDFPSLESGRLTALSAYIANKAGNRLIEANRSVVDRGALEKIISEQKLQQNALMDAATAAKVGRLAGAGVFIVGNYSVLTKKFAITVRALSVETGQFVAAAEETVPLNPDLKLEVDELQSKAMASASAPNLSGDSSSDDSETAAAPAAEDKKTADFDKKVCALINKGTPALQLMKMAFQDDIVELNAYGPDGLNLPDHSDSSGESQRNALDLGHWWFALGMGYINRSEIGAAYKGHAANYPSVDFWLYDGPTPLTGCIAKPGWWNSERATPNGKKKKKK